MTEYESATAQSDLAEEARKTWDATKTRSLETLREGEALVRANPIPVVLGAVGVGLLVGFLLGHREKSWQERYTEQPVEELRQLVTRLSHQLAHQMNQQKGAATDAMHSLGGRLRSYFR